MAKKKKKQEIDLSDLTILKGVGPTGADKLFSKGIKTITDVSVQRHDDIAAILEINKLKAMETVNQAKELALSLAIPLFNLIEQKEEIEDKILYYSTGSKVVDAMIGGGIATNELTGLRGKYSTGKTQVCYSAAVDCIVKGRVVAWVETEPGTFKTDRLYQIAEARGINVDPNDLVTVNARFITTPNHQFNSYRRVEQLLESGVDIGLIIVDSFSTRFREFYTRREMFPARSQEQMRHIGFLQTLAAKYNLAVMMTIQVMGIPDAGKQLEVRKEEADDSGMYGGAVLKHCIQTWLSLTFRSKSQGIWRATLFDSSSMPYGEAEFTIGPDGVSDIVQKGGRG